MAALNYFTRNLMIHCFNSLKEKERYIKEGSSETHYEAFWEQLNQRFNLAIRAYRPTNAIVEAFYRGTFSMDQFLNDIETNILKKASDKLDVNYDPLLTISWDVYRTGKNRLEICEKLPRLCGRQLWAIFNKLDEECSGFVHIDDVVEIVLKIFTSQGRMEDPQNIREWFCEQNNVDFWSLFSALVENHQHLLGSHVIQTLYEEVVYEILKQGKMTKKGHKVQTWKDRWFVLTSTNLYYYESLENRIQKGVIVISKNTRVDSLPSLKGKNYLFRVTDGGNGRIYDISAPDPQALQDWTEILNVIVTAHSENGRNLIHRLNLSRSKLYPSSVKISHHVPSSPVEYNEGIYRVVRPTGQSQTTSNAPNIIPIDVPSEATWAVPPVKSAPIKPVEVQNEMMRAAPVKSTPTKSQGPPVVPYHQNKIEHVMMDGHDYALVDKVVEDVQQQTKSEEPPPPIPPFRSSPNPLPPSPTSPISTSMPLPAPIPTKMDQVSPEPVTPVPPKPKPRTKGKIQDNGANSSYAQLTFNDEEISEIPVRQIEEQSTSAKVSAQIKRSVPDTKFDYCDVLLIENTMTQDVETAQRLKANKPPPPMPAKYTPGNKTTVTPQSNSDSSLHTKKNHSYENTHFNATNNMRRTDSDEAPPPPPRRLESKRSEPTISGAPAPPPRSNRDLQLPPLPPR